MRKKLLSVALCVALAASTFAGCGDKKDDAKETTTKAPASDNKDDASQGENKDNNNASAEGGSVYFLNFKPEIEQAYTELMKKFTEETKIEAKVVTAANNGYEQQLKSEMGKEDAPTLFTINGLSAYEQWKDYCADTTGTDIYNTLTESGKSMVLAVEDGVYGLPLCVETYGIICNKAIFEKYFALEGIADTGCKKIEDINSFEKLKAVTEDMKAKAADLGIKAPFSRPALGSDDNWRMTNHLFNVPLYYEYQADGVTDKAEIEFKFNKEYKNILDLYIDNSPVERKMAGEGSVNDAMTEFAKGEVAMVQNGVWAWSGDTGLEKQGFKAEDLYYMPIYTGAEGEEKQGLCTGTENYVAVNSQASEEDQAASLEFLKWLYTSETGKAFVVENYGIAPYQGLDNSVAAAKNPLIQLAVDDEANTETKTAVWTFQTIPGKDWKAIFGENLLAYAQGSMEWDAVVTDAVEKWKAEK